jgi:16S rRNA (adenine1518-N6/adenine1519-N6)-dimethyltransferase
LEEICNFAGVNGDDYVLEIGPGLGFLTAKLLTSGATVHAVEFDKTLAVQLSDSIFKDELTVEHADILKFNLNNLPRNYKVVANLPYYITSAIVRKMLEAKNPPANLTLLVQKEVANRIAAEAGNMSLLSISAQFYADVRLGAEVAAELFDPPPKVDSRLVRLDYTGAKFKDIEAKKFFQVVKAGFGERRKKLRSSLSGGLNLDKKQVDEILKKAEISENARAQELSLEQWNKLARLF